MNIVVAVDGSKYGWWAVEWVAHLPLATPMKVKALHVIDDQSLRAPLTPQPVPVWNEAFIQNEIKRRVAEGKRLELETKNLFSSLELKGKVVTERGLVAPTLLKHAKGRGDLIVVGSRGLDAMDRFLLGSISTKVLNHAVSSVLVVKQEPRALSRILLAIDGSKASDKAVQFMIKKMVPLKMQATKQASVLEVAVLHVMPYVRYPELKETGKAVVQHAGERLAKAGYQVEEVSKIGQPAEEIIQYAEWNNVDLIVIGSRGLGAVARVFLGSVSSRIVHHSPCSVLVLR